VKNEISMFQGDPPILVFFTTRRNRVRKFRKALMLRAEVPPDVERITFDDLYDCDDMWTHLFGHMCMDLGIPEFEVWHYNGGPREVQYTQRMKERWVPDLRSEDVSDFDLVFARGGFQEYIPIIDKVQLQAYTIYYGAGKRFYPIPEGHYDLVLVDSKEQGKIIKDRMINQKVALFIKPASDNIFKPLEDTSYPLASRKNYDVCVAFQLASYTKRFELVMQALNCGGYSALVIGNVDERLKNYCPYGVCFAGRLFRKELPKLFSQCRVGLATHSQLESCPRVIPEFLACDLPIVVTSDTLFWKEKYITKDTGVLTKPDPEKIAQSIQWVLENKWSPRKYYEENLTVRCAARYLAKVIDEEGTYPKGKETNMP